MLTSPQTKLAELLTPRATPTLHLRISGKYKCEVRRNGELVQDTGWFDNLILNQGKDMLGALSVSGTTNVSRYCQIGTGTSTPVATQTQLDSRVASREYGDAPTSYTNAGAPSYSATFTIPYVFPQGAVVGNMSEVGVSPVSDGNLFSRSRIVDTGGAPTTLSLTSIDQLTVYYAITFVPTLGPVSGTVNLEGVDYPYTVYLADGPGFLSSSAPTLTLSSTYYPFCGFPSTGSGPVCLWAFPAGTGIGTPVSTSGPPPNSSGSQTYVMHVGNGFVSSYSYTPGTYTATASLIIPPSAANFSGGLQGFYALLTGFSIENFRVYFYFPTPIPKTNTKQLKIVLTTSWA